MNANLLNDLAEYVGVLSASLETTRRAEDRSAYVAHLAASALIFQSLVKDDFSRAREHLIAEQQVYGRSFLAGDEVNPTRPFLLGWSNRSNNGSGTSLGIGIGGVNAFHEKAGRSQVDFCGS
jgi:hypothetical protein